MKAIILILAMILFGMYSCQSQEKSDQKTALNAKKENSKPQGSWKVNRDYDENGNLISYDSTYTYSYSSVNGDTISSENMDEIISQFRQYLGQNGMNDQSALIQSFFNDSIRGDGNFFHGDLSTKHFNSESIQQQIREMDSLQQQFLNQHYPQFFEKQEEKSTQTDKTKYGNL